MGPISEHHLMLFLMQFALVLGLCKFMGYFFEKMKQSSVTSDILVGIMLGPAILGKLFPGVQAFLFPAEEIQRSMLETIAWFGNLFLLMEAGLEINFSRVWQQRSDAIKLSLADLTLPIIISFIPIYFLPSRYLIDPSHRVLFALFIAAVMTISALPVAIRGMRDLNILKTDVGFLILSALTINDIAGWVIFTIILGIFSHGSLELGFISRLVILTLAFTFISLTFLRKIVDKMVTFIHEKTGDGSGLKITFIMLIGAIFGAITLKIGIHALFGFFIAGTILGEATHISKRDRFVVNRLVYSVFVPIFFANIGLHLDFVANFDWFLVLVMLVVGISARFSAAYIGSRWSKQHKSNLAVIAVAHTPGGEMHIVVGMLAFGAGLISEKILVSIIASALISTIIFGPWLALAVRKLRKTVFDVLFTQEDVFIDIDSNSQEEMIRIMSDKVAQRTELSAQTIFHEIQLREDQMSTAMGKALAIPHARLEGIQQSYLFVFHVRQGLEWDSPDGNLVRFIVLVVTPKDSPNAQIQILQGLANALHDRKKARSLVNSRDRRYIWAVLRTELDACQHCSVS
ncbi:MAG: cation:proton antiporter [Candidatus Cloacimonetes bacterium]|jgi:Kef-type K+ transport system membrane component KefB/mannitol/fructose-specific phosphotransferase system IIA component (Ntr-type)|nr:cation:proton antiporter [Candidatus Cloacimonadota bacterium]MCB5286395.1 cation:proton antiporter [Candidatus Cloacimonadota bacterium]MCK9184467.1 cation:proton antiporter [Candidatus Cloacimonadota bacterium]MCK9584118.1 cation:proton antiporter [Candidatus Cloacimonadota bacterium]MDY0228717.1 cation:proton antiporter [Candidatus Cloacimonadaceae bacterium]